MAVAAPYLYRIIVLLLFVDMAEIKALSLPPKAAFPSYQALFDSVQAHRKLAGYALIVKKSKTRKGKCLKVLSCKRERKERCIVNKEY
jgi:hypothetical protein